MDLRRTNHRGVGTIKVPCSAGAHSHNGIPPRELIQGRIQTIHCDPPPNATAGNAMANVRLIVPDIVVPLDLRDTHTKAPTATHECDCLLRQRNRSEVALWSWVVFHGRDVMIYRAGDDNTIGRNPTPEELNHRLCHALTSLMNDPQKVASQRSFRK
jgi:hypothetical protein